MSPYQQQLRDMNEALLVSSVHQHELTGRAERAAAELREREEQLRRLNETLEQRVVERTAALTRHRERLRELVRELERTEAHERKRIAIELHDNLAQMLAVCKMKVSAIAASAPPDSLAAMEATAVKQLLGQGMKYTRTLMSDLRPDALDFKDLTYAVRWIATRMTGHGLAVRVADDGIPKALDEELLMLIFDSVRELLFNVIKHAGTDQATVSLQCDNGELRVTVSDEGKGFDPRQRAAAPSEKGGFGLFSVDERVGLLGGRMEVDSAPGRGAAVRMVVPLRTRHGREGATQRRVGRGASLRRRKEIA